MGACAGQSRRNTRFGSIRCAAGRRFFLISVISYLMSLRLEPFEGDCVKARLLPANPRETLKCVLPASALAWLVECGGTDSVIVTGIASNEPSPTPPSGAPDASADPGQGNPDSAPGADPGGYLVVVTERESPETSLQYLHLLKDWPESHEVDNGDAIELGEFVNVHTMGDAIFVHQPDDATVRRLVVGASGSIADDSTVSFAAYGVTGFSGDMVYVSPERAYFVDEGAAEIVVWNPDTMRVLGSAPIPEAALTRGGLPAQISRGFALGGEAFVAASWRNWDTLEYHDSAALGVFDAGALTPELRIIEDERCASTVTTPF